LLPPHPSSNKFQNGETFWYHHHHIYFRLPERPQKPIELATIKTAQRKLQERKKYKKVIKNDFKNKKYIKDYAARPKQTSTTT